MRFADMRRGTDARYVVTSKGIFHLTPTELEILCIVEEREGEPVSKMSLALRLHRNYRVIGRLVSHLRNMGAVESFATYAEGGAQLANEWRIAPGARPVTPADGIAQR